MDGAGGVFGECGGLHAGMSFENLKVKIYVNGAKIDFSTEQEQQDIHMQKNEVGSLPYTIHKY